MKKVTLLLISISLIIFMSGCILSGRDTSLDKEINEVQQRLDVYNSRLDAYSDSDCYLEDNGLEILVQCNFGTISSFGENQDIVNFYYESSGGTVNKWVKYIPHFEPIQKSKELKLTIGGADYLFECNQGSFDQKSLPYVIMKEKDIGKYKEDSKEKCLLYTDSEKRNRCFSCLFGKVDSLRPSPRENYCEDIGQYVTPYNYGYCIGNVAAFNSNLKICDGELNQVSKDECYFNYARVKREVQICDKIKDAGRRETCIMFVGEIIADVGPR